MSSIYCLARRGTMSDRSPDRSVRSEEEGV